MTAGPVRASRFLKTGPSGYDFMCKYNTYMYHIRILTAFSILSSTTKSSYALNISKDM